MVLPNGPVSTASETEVMLFRLVDEYDRHYEAAAAELSLTAAQACVLGRLEGPRRMSELAVELGCDASNVTQIVARLETLGLAQRQRHPDDRRARVVARTPRGQEVTADFEARFGFARSAIHRLSAAEQRQFGALMSKALGPELDR